MRNEYKTTTNTRLFNILHKEAHASCSHCTWHTRYFSYHNENDAWKYYCIYTDTSKFYNTKYPNWKLVGKQNKQWKLKKLYYKLHDSPYNDITWLEIRW